MSLVSNILKHPFKYYFRAGSITFGTTFVCNTVSSLTYDKSFINPITDPQIFASTCFMKSAYFGFLWPSVPFVLAINPKQYFVLGNWMNEVVDSNENKIDIKCDDDLDKSLKKVEEYIKKITK